MVELFNAIKAASYMAAKKDVRYYLNGVHIVKEDGIVTVESSNGHTAFQCKNDNLNIIIPNDDINTILKLGKDLVIKDGKVNGVFKFDVIDGNFPDLDRVIPKSGEYGPVVTNGCMNFSYLEAISKSIKAINGSSKEAGGNIEFIPKHGTNEVSSYRITCKVDGPVWVLMPMRGL